MFGFWSLSALSSLGGEIATYNGEVFSIVLHIQEDESIDGNIQRLISLDLALQKESILVL